MIITKLPHAGMIVSAEGTKILCDPLFPGPLIESVFELPSSFKINKKALRQIKFDAVLISHHHGDHFHLPSLNYIHRDCPVFFPLGSHRMAAQLKKIGFTSVKPMEAGQRFVLGAIEVIPTISRVLFPEVGFIFRHQGVNVWNLVDSRPHEADLKNYYQEWGQPDLLFAYYQCMNESKIINYGFGSRFPFEFHQKNLNIVRYSHPKAISPSSCDLFHSTEPWMNHHLFPVSKEKFIRDVQAAEPQIKGHLLEAGAHIHVSAQGLRAAKDPFPHLKIRSGKTPQFEWKPEVGQQKFFDHSATKKPLKKLKTEAQRFLDQTFPEFFLEQELFLKSYIKDGVIWQLRLLLPDGTEIKRSIDFSQKPLAWLKKEPPHWDFATLMSAGDFLDYVQGKLDPYILSGGGYCRVVDRYYRMINWEVKPGFSERGTPSLIPQLTEKLAFVLRETYLLNELGYSP